jgi:hypothetical protein
MASFRQLGTNVTNQNYIHEELGPKRRLNSEKACYHEVQELFSSQLLSVEKLLLYLLYYIGLKCGLSQ